MGKMLLLITCVIGFGVMAWSMKGLYLTNEKDLFNIGSILIMAMALRYITLVVYALATSPLIIESLRYFYYASSIGLTMLTVCGIWFIIPFWNQRFKVSQMILFFLPWISFYIYLILKQPTWLVGGTAYGYELILIPPFNRYLAIVQGSFITVIAILAIIGLIRYKHLQIRIQLAILLLAQGLLVIDGIYSGKEVLLLFKLFTVSEIFGLWTIGYAFWHPMRRLHVVRKIKDAS